LEPPAPFRQSQPFAEFTLNGYDQPLHVQLLARPQGLFQQLNWGMLLISALISAALVAAVYLVWSSRQQSKQHQQQARQLANEAQLAHASRVNSMGEMASGIAHELAQPVTALLSQSQAALRAHERGKPDLLAAALQAN